MLNTEELLSSIAPIPEYQSDNRFSYIIVGKPGVGKSTLAGKLSILSSTKHLNFDNSIETALQNPESANALEIINLLKNGELIRTDRTFELLQNEALQDSTIYQGIVLDGIPLADDYIYPDLQFRFLRNIVKEYPNLALIELKMCDEDLVRHRAGLWHDPVTNKVYPAAQVVYSRQRRQQGWIDGEKDSVFEAELLQLKTNFMKQNVVEVKPPIASENGTEEDAEEDLEMQEKEVKPLNFSLNNPRAYPILSAEILERLVKCPEDYPANVQIELKKYKEFEVELDKFKKSLNILHVFELDGTQHPDTIFYQLETLLQTRGILPTVPLIKPKKLLPIDSGFGGMTETAIIKFFSNQELVDGEPERDLSEYKLHCPVSFATKGTLTPVDMQLCSVFKGKLYFFKTEIEQALFFDNPEKYLCKKLELRGFTLFVTGWPSSGKSFVSRAFAKKYELVYINIDETLEKWGEFICSNSKPESYFKDIFEKVKSVFLDGECIGPSLYAEIFLAIVNQIPTGSGWVSDGYPRSAEEVNALVEKNVIPIHYLIIKTEPGIEELDRYAHLPREVPIKGLDSVHDANIFHNNVCLEYISKIPGILEAAKPHDIHMHSVSWDVDAVVMLTSCFAKIDPFLPLAVPVSKRESDLLGKTKFYCPVTLNQRKILRKGDLEFADEVYIFASSELRDLFCSKPYYFTKNVVIPPPKLAFLGHIGTRTTELMTQLGRKYQIPYVNFKSFCSKHINEAPDNIKTEYQSADDNKFNSVLLEYFFPLLWKTEPFASKGALIDHFVTKKQDVELVLATSHLPDAFVILNAEAILSAKRSLPSERLEIQKLEDERLESLKGATEDVIQNSETLLRTDERILEELVVKIESQKTELDDIVSTIDKFGSVSVVSVSTTRCNRAALAEMDNALKQFISNRLSIMETPVQLDTPKADLFLNIGVRRGKITIAGQGRYPVSNRKEIIYLRSEMEVKQYLENPKRYLPKDIKPALASTAIILGQPKSGKTKLTKSLASDPTLVRISVPEILESIISGGENTLISEQIISCLKSGSTLEDIHVVNAIFITVKRIISSGRGWILDNYPLTEIQAKLLDESGVIPHFYIDLKVPDEEIKSRVHRDFNMRDAASVPMLDFEENTAKLNELYNNEINRIRQFVTEKYGNWIELDGLCSSWWLRSHVASILNANLQQRERSLDLRSKGLAAPISGTGWALNTIQSHFGHYLNYCPVSFVDKEELRTNQVSSLYVAEYKGKTYIMDGNDELETFISTPEYYLNKYLPEILPKSRPRDEMKSLFPKTLALKGYCPVTFFDGSFSIVPGNFDVIVEYGENIYCFAGEEELSKFMRKPWKYSTSILPKKLPPPNAPIPVSGMPIVGYLEQSIAAALTKALEAVGARKPKHPFATLGDSAGRYVALYLKATNENSSKYSKEKYAAKLKEFEERCELMTRLIHNTTQQNLTFADSNADINADLDRFISLKME